METRSLASTKTNEWRLAASLVPPRCVIPTDWNLPLLLPHAMCRFYYRKMGGKGSPSYAIPMSEGEAWRNASWTLDEAVPSGLRMRMAISSDGHNWEGTHPRPSIP